MATIGLLGATRLLMFEVDRRVETAVDVKGVPTVRVTGEQKAVFTLADGIVQRNLGSSILRC